MLTPIEIHNKQHKTGRGYSKKEMDEFLDDVLEGYESLYKENIELKDKISKLSEGVQYYKSIENTLQKALVLAEKTSKDTIETANSKASLIEKEALVKADQIINKACSKCEYVRQQCNLLIQHYNQFKMQFKQIAVKQIDLLDSDFYDIYSNDLINKLNETIDCVPTDLDNSSKKKASDSESDDETIPAQQKVDFDESLVSKCVDDSIRIIKVDKTKQSDKTTSVDINEKELNNDAIDNNKISIDNDELKIDDDSKPDVSEFESAELTNNTDIEESEKDNNGEEDLDNLLRDIKKDLAKKVNSNLSEDSSFEFLDNDEL